MSHKVKQVSIYSLDKFSHLRNWIVFVLSSTTRAWIKRRHGFGFYFGSGTLGILAIIVLTLISADSYLCFMITSNISRRCWMSLGAMLSCVCSSAWHQSRLFLYVFVCAWTDIDRHRDSTTMHWGAHSQQYLVLEPGRKYCCVCVEHSHSPWWYLVPSDCITSLLRHGGCVPPVYLQPIAESIIVHLPFAPLRTDKSIRMYDSTKKSKHKYLQLII